MSALDWVIVGFTVLLAFYGYVQGFIVGALSLVGFAVGAFVGTRLAPLLLSDGARSPYAPLFGLLGALLAGGVFASGLEGVGTRVRSALRLPGLRTVDGLLGAALTACVGLGIAWMIGAVALDASTSQPLRADIQDSTILRALDRILPPSGPILNALARFDPLPSVRGPAPDVPAPTRRILASAGVRLARHSVVRVFGTACGLGVEGSGWVVAPDLVVTNAHVVAGESDTRIQIDGEGPGHPGRVVVFDPRNDIAILQVPGLGLRPLAVAAAPAQERRRRSSATRWMGHSTPSRDGWGRPRPSTPRTPTARGTCCAASRRCAAGCVPATRADRWWTGTARSWPPCSPR